MTDVERGEWANSLTRPSLPQLKWEQQKLMSEGVSGLLDRRDVLVWLIRVSARTYGRIADAWYSWIGTTPSATAVWIRDTDRRNAMLAGDTEMSDGSAKEWRNLQVEKQIDPACSMALKDLRKQASQYARDRKDGSDLPDPKDQQSPGMRPVVKETQNQQKETLTDLLDGFENREEVRKWVGELREATEQLLPHGFLSGVLWKPKYRTPLLGGPEYWHMRAQIAGNLLSLFNRAMRHVAATSNEYVDEMSTRHSPTKGF